MRIADGDHDDEPLADGERAHGCLLPEGRSGEPARRLRAIVDLGHADHDHATGALLPAPHRYVVGQVVEPRAQGVNVLGLPLRRVLLLCLLGRRLVAEVPTDVGELVANLERQRHQLPGAEDARHLVINRIEPGDGKDDHDDSDPGDDQRRDSAAEPSAAPSCERSASGRGAEIRHPQRSTMLSVITRRRTVPQRKGRRRGAARPVGCLVRGDGPRPYGAPQIVSTDGRERGARPS